MSNLARVVFATLISTWQGHSQLGNTPAFGPLPLFAHKTCVDGARVSEPKTPGDPVTASETIDAGPFSVDVAPQLALRYHGSLLFSGDRCVSFRGLKPGEPALVDPAKGRVIRKDNVITLLAKKGRNTFRREILVTPEAVHVTFEMRISGNTGGSHLQYDLLSPSEFLDGVAYEAWTGAARGPLKKETGAFDIENSKPLEYLVRSARYFILKRPGAECSLDFNPSGAWQGESNYGVNASTTPYHDGKRFHFLMLCSGGRYGGVFRGKIVIRPGAQPYESLHSTAAVAYTQGYPVALALNFSKTASNGDYEPCRAEVPADKLFRWRDPKLVRIVERSTGGMLYRDFATSANGQTDGVLELKQRSGLYLLTLNMCDVAENTGPFTVSGPDGPLVTNVSIKRGKYWFKTVPLRIRNGKTTVRFTGNWKIGALTLQSILYETEDFLFDQPFWNMNIR